MSEAPRAPARGICGEAKRNYAEATRLRPTGYAAVACRHFIGPKPLAKADPPRASTRGMLAKASEYFRWISATRLDRPGQGDWQDTPGFKSRHFEGVFFSHLRFGSCYDR